MLMIYYPKLTLDEVEAQISQVKQLLSTAGFSLKYVIRTGDKPGDFESSDGITVKMLGYKWNTVSDTLHPGISELNINKKVRGIQKPNPNPVISEQDAVDILKFASLSRRIIISKIAEFFDPIGLWKPLKLQLKLHSARLNKLPWHQKLSTEDEVFWKSKLIQFVRFHNLVAPRCTTPLDSRLQLHLPYKINLYERCSSLRWRHHSVLRTEASGWNLDL